MSHKTVSKGFRMAVRKVVGESDSPMRQIEDRGYAVPYAADKRTLYKIGCSFSSETGTIEDWKVVE